VAPVRTRQASGGPPRRPSALKVRRRGAEEANVRFERLVIEAGSNTVTLDLHPRLTVIAGAGRLEREALIG